MRLVFASWESGCEEVSTKEWTILADSIVSTSKDIVIYQGDILGLEDGTVYIYNSSGAKKPYLIGTSFSSSRFISFHAAYEKLFLINEEGRLFGCGQTAFGECGVISPNPIDLLREIELVTPLAVCPHGCLVTTAESLKVRLVRTSASEVCVIDFHDQLWKYGDGRLDFDSLGRIQVRPLQLASKRKILQLCAGRKHFVCLTVPLTDEKNDTDVENSPALGIRQLNKCDKCREEYELRLSTLMYMADQKSESRDSFASYEKELTMKESFAVRNPCLFLDGDNNPAKYQTLPLCNSPRAARTAIGKPLEQTSFDEVGTTEIKNTYVWDGLGKDSTFVSIGNPPDMYYKQNTNTENLSPSCTVRNGSPSSDRRTSLADSQNDLDLLPEIWTWGSNENGQLGHGDLAVRRNPFKVVDLSNMYCIKVAAGDDHTIALTGAGKLYVWGSNSNGQLKQTDLSYITKPTLFKVGSHSFVLDAFASGCQTGIIVGGIANFPTVYLCGSNIMKKSPQLLSLPKEIGWPGWIIILNKNLVIGVYELSNKVDEYFQRMFAFFRYTEFVQQICQLCQKMHERREFFDYMLFVVHEIQKFMGFEINGLMKLMRNDLCDRGNLSVGTTLKTFITKYLLSTFFQFHADYIDCLAYGCFTKLDIWDEIHRTDWNDIISIISSEVLGKEMNKTCLCHNLQGSSQEIRLRQLFQLAFNCPYKLADLAGIGNILEVRINFGTIVV